MLLAAPQDCTQYRPTADTTLVQWIIRRATWPTLRFGGGGARSPLYRVVGDCHRGKELEIGVSVLAPLLEVGKGSGNLAPKLVDTWNFAVWLDKSDLADGHLVGTDDCIVCARCARRTTLVRRELPRSRRDHRRRSRRRLLRLTLKVFLPPSVKRARRIREGDTAGGAAERCQRQGQTVFQLSPM